MSVPDEAEGWSFAAFLWLTVATCVAVAVFG